MPKRQSAKSGDLLTRYKRGDHVAVWKDLRRHKKVEGDLREEALAVARETMHRVAAATDLVAARLKKQGWIALSGRLRARPTSAEKKLLAKVAAASGAPLPVSPQAFWEIVGGVDFVWNYDSADEVPELGEGLNLTAMDPLCVASLRESAGMVLEDWSDPEFYAPCFYALAPDALHKDNTSGDSPYGITLPFAGADPIFKDAVHDLPFVDYLRLCFKWAGFPGLVDEGMTPAVRQFVAPMTKGIEPF